jgi:endonuclease/exonuclease/phosphatase family metal-dependent hydrolase
MMIAVGGRAIPYPEPHSYGSGHSSRAGILTTLPVLSASTVPLPHRDGTQRDACVTRVRLPSGRVLIAATGHLAWGGAAEGERFKQARIVDAAILRQEEAVSNSHGQEPICVFGGDFNCTPDSRTMRWLRGLEPGPDEHDTQWLDAWLVAGDGSAGYTSTPDNPLGQDIARQVGIMRPERNPYRRIDYILVKGWRHGRPGDPLYAGLFGGDSITGSTMASDHLGVWADLADDPFAAEP